MKKKDNVEVSIGDSKIGGGISAAFAGMAEDLAKHSNPRWLNKAWRWQHRLYCPTCRHRAKERQIRALIDEQIAYAFRLTTSRSRYNP